MIETCFDCQKVLENIEGVIFVKSMDVEIVSNAITNEKFPISLRNVYFCDSKCFANYLHEYEI